MLKPLLRTLPSLSGNVKLACSLTDYIKLSENDFSSTVRLAKLLPLSSVLSQRNIEANLLYSTYDFDLKRFFKYYSQYFFNDVFEYDKGNYILVDKTDTQKNRNTDFEFGCKRVSYLKNEKQFAFYTPIYVESLEDLPDYFEIHIKLKNNKYEIEKSIKVNLKSNSKYNYLYIYLKNYLEKLDTNVVFCNSGSKQAVYYGIDLLKGGFLQVVDNVIAKIYTDQNTINNFDAIISQGFERNNLCIRQIIPLCWYFNINDILTEDEEKKFKNSEVFIDGVWYKNEQKVSFYDIDTNYQYYYENPYMINTNNGLFSYINTGKNILDTEYPSLNESKYINYRYSNKLNKRYNRWKLKYSDDSHPYITNLSPAFSMNQKSVYRYGNYPTDFTSLKVFTDVNNNIILPIGNALSSEESIYSNDYALVSNYENILNNNVSTWYTLKNDLSNIYNEDIWKDTLDNKVYYKGILYDLSKIYDEYPSLIDTIDKFSVLVNVNFNKLDKDSLKEVKKADMSFFNSDKYITDKTCWISERVNDGLSSGQFSEIPSFFNTESSLVTGNSQIVFDKLYIGDDEGDFIDLLDLGYDVYEVNKYYKYSDIIFNFSEENGYFDDIIEVLTKNPNFNEFFIEGYEILPIYKLNNILHENGRNILFEGKDSVSWVLDNLYFSQHGNYFKSHYDRDTIVKLIKDYGEDSKMVPLYLKNKFICKKYLISLLYDYYGESYSQFLRIFNNLVEYRFYPRLKDETSATYASDVFVKRNTSLGDNWGNYIPSNRVDNDVIYVDPYNLNNVISTYNSRYNKDISSITEGELIETYAKFLNMKHLLYYISDLYKDIDNTTDLLQLFNSLYIKKRVIVSQSEIENLEFKDYYIHIYNLYSRFRLITNEEKKAILDGVAPEKFNYLYKKVNNLYSNKAYKRFEPQPLDFDENIYYYIPDLYIKKQIFDEKTNETSIIYTLLSDVFAEYLSEEYSDLVNYANKDIIDRIENQDIKDIDISTLNLGGIRYSNNDTLSNNNSANKDRIKSNLLLIKELYSQFISKYKYNIYYKALEDDNTFISYQYKRMSEYIILDSVETKKRIIDGEIHPITYIINKDGEFIRKDYGTDDCYVIVSEDDEDYPIYMNSIISSFASDIKFNEEDNYFSFSDNYFKTHNEDDLVDIPDIDGEYNSSFKFEIVYKKQFVKLNTNLFNLIGLENIDNVYKDLYLYKIYKEDEYPSSLRMYILDLSKYGESLRLLESTKELTDTTNCLSPLFDDIHLQEKKYSVIYSEYNQANIYEVVNKNTNNYRFNQSDITFMYDISNQPKDKEYEIVDIETGKHVLCYTYNYYKELEADGNPAINGHAILPTYKLLNSCYSDSACISDDLHIYDKFKINTYTVSNISTYTYSYISQELQTVTKNGTSYTSINDVERTGIGYSVDRTTYGFILLNSYIDNTNVSFNIIDSKYKKKKYFTSINEHDIYDHNYSILDTFNLLVPVSNIRLIDNLKDYKDFIIKPRRYSINTYYKQTPIIDDSGYTYAYNINHYIRHIDTLTLERYFDSIVPNIQPTVNLNSTYCLKYKDYRYPTTDINYKNDIFYNEDINIYNYNRLRVYNSENTYTLFSPIEYKHLNNNKVINLSEEFEIEEYGKFTYDELIEKEQDTYVLEKFKKYLLSDKLNTYDDDQILFLFNRYNIKYDSVCVGLNSTKTEKLYTLKYKFTLL